MGTKTEPPEESSFESVMGRLEEIVEKMEAQKMPLEELLVSYEEGVKLAKICSEKLDAAEKRIEIITRQAAGKPKAVEFEPKREPAEAATPGAAGGADASLF